MTPPNRPGRPNHADFWLLSEVVIDMDNVAKSGKTPFEDQVGRMVDPESLIYMARQRSLRTRAHSHLLEPALASLWLDGFMVGAAYQARTSTPGPELCWVVGRVGENGTSLARFATHDDAAAFIGSVLAARDPEGVTNGGYYLDGPPE